MVSVGCITPVDNHTPLLFNSNRPSVLVDTIETVDGRVVPPMLIEFEYVICPGTKLVWFVNEYDTGTDDPFVHTHVLCMVPIRMVVE